MTINTTFSNWDAPEEEFPMEDATKAEQVIGPPLSEGELPGISDYQPGV